MTQPDAPLPGVLAMRGILAGLLIWCPLILPSGLSGQVIPDSAQVVPDSLRVLTPDDTLGLQEAPPDSSLCSSPPSSPWPSSEPSS